MPRTTYGGDLNQRDKPSQEGCFTGSRFITGSSVTGLRLSIPFERDVFIFAFLASFLVRPGCRFLGPACGSCGRCVTPRSGTAVGHRRSRHPASLRAASHNATMLSNRTINRAARYRFVRLSLIPSPVSLFCPGSAHGRRLMGSDEDRPANLLGAW